MQTSSVRSEGRPYTYRTSNEVFLYRTLNDPILEQVCQRVEMMNVATLRSHRWALLALLWKKIY
jgi:hypothetical protein